jgi:hypothetical protein
LLGSDLGPDLAIRSSGVVFVPKPASSSATPAAMAARDAASFAPFSLSVSFAVSSTS